MPAMFVIREKIGTSDVFIVMIINKTTFKVYQVSIQIRETKSHFHGVNFPGKDIKLKPINFPTNSPTYSESNIYTWLQTASRF